MNGLKIKRVSVSKRRLLSLRFVPFLFLSVGLLLNFSESKGRSLTFARLGESSAKTPARLPAVFEPNMGQANPAIKFLARYRMYDLFFLPNRILISVRSNRDSESIADNAPSNQHPIMEMQFMGANPDPAIVPENKARGTANYFLGPDSAHWITDLATYEKLRYMNVYPGIDLIFYGDWSRAEYDIAVSPGADPSKVRLSFQGMQKIEIDADGNLILHSPAGRLVQSPPKIYQMVGNTRQYIEGGYVIENGTVVRFKLNAYDRDKTVVIDPVLAYASFLGGGVSDGGEDIAVDRAGNIYVTGFTFSANFPTKNALQNSAGASDIFITKIDKSGSSLLYSSFIGGSGFDAVSRIAVDAAGNVYLAGGTSSTDFPVTSGAIQSKFGGGDRDAFVLSWRQRGLGSNIQPT